MIDTPVGLGNLILKRPIIKEGTLCYIFGTGYYMTTFTSYLSIAMIAFSRCLHVTNRHLFSRIFSRFRGKLACLCLWIISIVHMIPVFIKVLLVHICEVIYSSVHIKESKVLHMTEVTGSCSLKPDYFDTQIFKNFIALFITLLLTPCKQNMGKNVRHNWISSRSLILMNFFEPEWAKKLLLKNFKDRLCSE